MRDPGFNFEEPFRFTRQERNAVFTLSILCVLSFGAPLTYGHLLPPPPVVDFSAFKADIQPFIEKAIAAAPAYSLPERREYPQNQSPKAEAKLFFFDPNTASKEELMRLGLSERTVTTFLKYRNTGARFRKREDLKKVYSIRPEDYARLEAWIQIEPSEAFAQQEGSGLEPYPKAVDYQSFERKYPPKAPVSLDINTASTEEWEQLPGIGPGYAKRILNFREKLGGFASVAQVGETFNLPDSVFQKALPHLNVSPVFRKIKVNSATEQELKAHPYFSNFQATVLFNYRQQHGRFADLAALKGGMKAGFKDSDWARLGPYLDFE